MIDDFAKSYLHDDLRAARAHLLGKLDGLSEYDLRRPLTRTGTNLLGLVKHLSLWEAIYFGEVFDRPFPEPTPRWDDEAAVDAHMWATEHESRSAITERYARAARHADATIDALPVDASGHVPWWPRPDVTLFNIMVHMLTETTRHLGHADLLREELDGSVGDHPHSAQQVEADDPVWRAHREKVEAAARVTARPEDLTAQPNHFVDRDLSGARFDRVLLSGAVLRGVDVNGAEIDSPWLCEEGGTLTVNGVDVVPFVDAELNRRFPGREQRRAQGPRGAPRRLGRARAHVGAHPGSRGCVAGRQRRHLGRG